MRLARLKRLEDVDAEALADLGRRGGGDKRVEDGCRARGLGPPLVVPGFDNDAVEPLGLDDSMP